MSDYLKEILSKKNLINILILAILVLAIPLTINLVRQQQILFSKAATDTVQLVDNLCTTVQNNKKVLTCPTLTLKFVAPSEVDVISAQGFVKEVYAQGACIYSQQDPDGVHCYSGICQEGAASCGFNNNCIYDPATSVQTACPGGGSSGASSNIPSGSTPVSTQCQGTQTWDQLDSQLKTAGWGGPYNHDQNELNVFNQTSCASATVTVTTCKGQENYQDVLNRTKQAGYTGPFDQASVIAAYNRAACPAGNPSSATASCPITASCCSTPLKTCGTSSSFNPTTAKDTSCPVGFQWCYSGYCISEKYDNKGTTGSCSTTTPATVCTPNAFDAQNCKSCAADGSFWGASGSDYGTNFNSPEWCSCARRFAQDYQSNPNYTSCRASAPPVASLTGPSSVSKQNNKWPDLTFSVRADSSTQWGLYYQNGPTCTVNSCTLQGWSPIGNTSSGNNTITWLSSSQSPNLQDVSVGVHTFAVINNPPTKVLATFDVNFTAGTTTASPTPAPAPIITKVRYAQNKSDLTNPNVRKEIAYRAGGVKEDITLTDTSVGTKFIFAQFIDDKGQTTDTNPSPFQIDLVGPSPIITGFSCEVDITKTDNSSDLLFKFIGANFGSTKGNITLGDGTAVNNIDSWSNIFVSARLNNPPLSQTAVGAQYTAFLTTKDGQKSLSQQCRVGITQISLGAKLFCRKEMNFDQDNIDLTLILDKDHAQKSREKVTIDKDGNITNIKTKLKSGESYIACIKAPLSLRKCSSAFTALAGNNILTIDLPVGDYNGDGAINNFDKSILQSQWGPMNATKNCDVNRDGACNSFEWSCMLHDFNASNQKEP